MMKLLKGIIVASLAIVSFMPVKGDIISKLPASTKVVAKLNLDRLRNSLFYANLEKQNLDKILQAQDKMTANIGIDPSTITSVWFAGVKQKEGMIILQGQFDAAAIRAAVSDKAECQIIERDDCELAVYSKKKNNPEKNLSVLLDQNTIITSCRE